MKKNIASVLIISAILLMSSSCVFIDDTSQLKPFPTSEPTTGLGYVKIVNLSDTWEIWSVYISDSDSYTWGNELLGDYDIIDTNSSRIFTKVPGTYDVRIMDDTGDYFTYKYITVFREHMTTLYFDGFTFEP